MFKKRLKETGINILVGLIGLGLFLLFSWLATVVPVIVGNVVTGVALLFIGLAILFAICYFINWLIIEPYKNWKRNKEV